MIHHNAHPSGAQSRLCGRAAITALVLCAAITKIAAAQIQGVDPIFTNGPPASFAPAGGIPGITISWQPTVCNTSSAIVVYVGSRSYSTTWTRTSGAGVMPATFVLSGGRSSVVSDDKTHKLVTPTLTMECILIQWKASIVSTVSWILYGERVIANTGTEAVVAPPKPKMMLSWGSLSGTALDISLPQGESATVGIDGSGSAPGDDGGPSISSYAWQKGGVNAGSSVSFSSTFPTSLSVLLTVTDAINVSASQTGSVTITPVYPCDDPLTEEVEDCNSNVPAQNESVSYGGSSEEPSWYVGGGGSTYVCYVTDWYQWNGSSWQYTDTTLDYCTFE